MKANERLELFIKSINIPIRKFEKNCGISPNTIQSSIRKKSYLREDNIVRIMTSYPDLNIEWLLTGKGKMIMEPEIKKINPWINKIVKSDILMLEFVNALKENDDSLMKNKLFELYLTWKIKENVILELKKEINELKTITQP